MSLAVCITRSEVTPNEVVRYGQGTVASYLQRVQPIVGDREQVWPLACSQVAIAIPECLSWR